MEEMEAMIESVLSEQLEVVRTVRRYVKMLTGYTTWQELRERHYLIISGRIISHHLTPNNIGRNISKHR